MTSTLAVVGAEVEVALVAGQGLDRLAVLVSEIAARHRGPGAAVARTVDRPAEDQGIQLFFTEFIK